jgi:hypothetical protein
LKGGIMNKNILAAFHLNKAKPFSIIKPFHGSLTLHDDASLAGSEQKYMKKWNLYKNKKPKKEWIPLSASQHHNLSLRYPKENEK